MFTLIFSNSTVRDSCSNFQQHFLRTLSIFQLFIHSQFSRLWITKNLIFGWHHKYYVCVWCIQHVLIQIHVAPWKKSYDKPRLCITKQRHHFANKVPYSESYGFSNRHIWIWELDHSRQLSTEELMLLNCGIGEDPWMPFGQQGDQTSQS